MVDDVLTLGSGFDSGKFSAVFGQKVVKLGNQALHGRDKLDKPFGNQHDTEVHTALCTLHNNISDRINNLVKGHILFLNLFRDDADVRLALKGAFQCDMAGRTPHEFDKVIIFLGRIAVALNVTDNFGIHLRSGVKTKRGFDNIVLKVAVDGFGATDNLHTCVDALIIFGKHCCIGVRIVATDNHKSLDVKLLKDFKTLVELFFGFKLGSS